MVKVDLLRLLINNLIIIIYLMQFRVRPSSKKSNNNDISSLQFPTIKSFNQIESPLPRPLAAKIDQFQSSLSAFQQLFRRERQSHNGSNLDFQKRLDKLQYKVFTAQQDIRQLNEIRDLRAARDMFGGSSESDPSKNEIIVLKQALLQEREAQKQNLKHQNSIIQQLTLKQMRAQQQLREMIVQQRIELEFRVSGQGEEIRQIEMLKQRKIEQQYDLMKGVIANAERKIYEQLQRKIQNEMIVKDYIQGKLIDLREEISNDHKETIVTEAKFIKQTKQSLQTLFALINNVRKELSQQLSETQKLSVKSIQKISGAVEILSRKHAQDLKQINTSYQQVNNELVQIRNFVTTKLQENRQFLSEFQEQTYQKLEHSDVYEKSNGSRQFIDGQRFSLFQKEMNQWKAITQQKNLNVFKEISNTLKTMKVQWRKQNDQLVSQVAALDESLRNMKKNGPAELKKNIQAIVTIFNNEFDVLADQLQSITQMIALAKKQNEKHTKQQINKVRSETIEQSKVIMNQKIKEGFIYTDKSISKCEENIKGLITKQVKYGNDALNKKIEKLQIQKNQLESAMKKANILTAAQLQDYSIKLKSFNDSYKEYLQQLRKDDLKKRMDLEEAMRNNASNLMDICYKKCQFLVEGLKKFIETSQTKERIQYTQIVQNAKDQLKKDVQGARLQWQKQLSVGLQKLTKQRQNSEQILHEAIQLSLSNTKTKLINDLNDAKIQLQRKLNDFKIDLVQKDAKKDAQNQKQSKDVKQQLQKALIQHQKRVQQRIQNTKKQFTALISEIQKTNLRNRQQIEQGIKNMLEDIKKKNEAEANASLKAEQSKQVQKRNKEQFDKQLNELSNETKTNSTKIEEINRKINDMAKQNTQKENQAQTQNKKVGEKTLKQLRDQLQRQIKQLQVKVSELQSNNEKEEQDQAINSMRKSINKVEAMVFSQQAKNKALFDRLTEDINKMSQSLSMIANQMRQ